MEGCSGGVTGLRFAECWACSNRLLQNTFELGAGFTRRRNHSGHAQSVSDAGETQDGEQFPHAHGIGDERFKTPLASGIHEFSPPVENS